MNDIYWLYSEISLRHIKMLSHSSNKNEFLSLENIGDFFTILIENGYKIDTEITKMLQQSSEKINNLICFISKIN